MTRLLLIPLAFIFPACTAVNYYHTHTPRWDVKTLNDAGVSSVDFLHSIPTSVQDQTLLPKESVTENSARLVREDTLYSLTAKLIGMKFEDEGDYHLVIQDAATSATMIAEIPDPWDHRLKYSKYRQSFERIRKLISSKLGTPSASIEYLNPPVKIRMTGVGFYDTQHVVPQEGMAPNLREIHPILDLEFP